jgi:Cys-rich repeat protein
VPRVALVALAAVLVVGVTGLVPGLLEMYRTALIDRLIEDPTTWPGPRCSSSPPCEAPTQCFEYPACLGSMLVACAVPCSRDADCGAGEVCNNETFFVFPAPWHACVPDPRLSASD